MVDFALIARGDKPREAQALQETGAAIFVRAFNGGFLRDLFSPFLPSVVRTETDTISLLQRLGLAEDEDSAREVIDYLKDSKNDNVYRGIIFDKFRFIELITPEGKRHYKICKEQESEYDPMM